jgi:hypothetical protein
LLVKKSNFECSFYHSNSGINFKCDICSIYHATQMNGSTCMYCNSIFLPTSRFLYEKRDISYSELKFRIVINKIKAKLTLRICFKS